MARIAKKVSLSEAEKSELTSLIKKGTHKSRKITRARVLLLLDSNKDRLQIQAELGIDSNHYYRIKKRFFAGGLFSALEELPRSGQPPIVTERLEAQITSLACSDAPAGWARWTLSLLNEKLVELEYIETICNESIRQVLKKANLSLGRSKCGASAL
jgi:putative transposase